MNVNMNQENFNAEDLRFLSEMSEEELDNVLAQVSSLVKKMARNDGQLTEEDLEQVAGGISFARIGAVLAVTVKASCALVGSAFEVASFTFDLGAKGFKKLATVADDIEKCINVVNTAATAANNLSSDRGPLDGIL